MAVLAASHWEWPELCDVKVKGQRYSRIVASKSNSPLMARIDPEWLKRWNGFPGTVATGSLELGPKFQGEKILWAKEPDTTVVALIPAAGGKGHILFSQLDIETHLDINQPNYDPAAERVLLELLSFISSQP